jgi:phenylpropionate dioxygenase-like ring-hydroxylating dioxygenase large terminal subunit
MHLEDAHMITTQRPTTRQPSPYVAGLLAGFPESVERGEVPVSIFGDEEIWRLELERIFGRTWNFVAHVTEIPNPGDYVARQIADTSLIVTHGTDGVLRALVDSCRHRGVKLCRGDEGNAASFRCPYHGWTYSNSGELIGVPNRKDGYGSGLDTSKWALLEARVEVYQGLVFATLDPDSVSLEDYLGDFRWYLDLHFGIAPDGLEVAGAPLRWIIPGNWKTAMENFTGDSYHTQTLHRSIFLAGIRPPTIPQNDYSVHVTNCSGHATSISRGGPDLVHYWGNGPAYERQYRESELSPEQLDLARRSMTGQGGVFPNFSFVHNFSGDGTTGENVGFFSLSLLHPASPTTIEIVRWMLVPSSATPEEKRRIYEVSVANFGPAGIFEEDDSVVWGGVAKTGASAHARTSGAMLNYTMGMAPDSAAKLLTDWPGPGDAYSSRLEDDLMLTLLRNWHRHMASDVE